MDDNHKNEANKSTSQNAANQGKGSGSDTLSAAKISAGTSVGNVGQSPMPQSGAGSSGGTGASGGTSAQSSTLASHTSKPMGGTGGTGASVNAGQNHGAQQGQGGGQSRGQSGSGQGGQSGMADQAMRAAGQAQERAGEVYERASEYAGEAYERASDMAGDIYERASGWASGAFQGSGRSMRGARSTGSGVQRYVAENPVMVGLVGLAAGLLIGALLPRTRREDETFGEWADEVREQGLRYAHEMAQRGREYVDETFSGDDPRFAHHESEFRQDGPRNSTGNRH